MFAVIEFSRKKIYNFKLMYVNGDKKVTVLRRNSTVKIQLKVIKAPQDNVIVPDLPHRSV